MSEECACPSAEARSQYGFESQLLSANRPIVEIIPANHELVGEEPYTVTLSTRTEGGLLVDDSHLRLRALVEVGSGHSRYDFECDWRDGVAFTVCASRLAVRGTFLTDSATTPDSVWLKANVARGTRGCPNFAGPTWSGGRTTLTQFATALYQIPRFAYAWSLYSLANLTVNTEINFYAGEADNTLFVHHVAATATAWRDPMKPNGVPPYARSVRVENVGAANRTHVMVFYLAL